MFVDGLPLTPDSFLCFYSHKVKHCMFHCLHADKFEEGIANLKDAAAQHTLSTKTGTYIVYVVLSSSLQYSGHPNHVDTLRNKKSVLIIGVFQEDYRRPAGHPPSAGFCYGELHNSKSGLG